MANSFEEHMEKLEEIIGNLEEGELDLQASVKAYEDGKALLKKLDAQLNKAESRIRILEEGEDA